MSVTVCKLKTNENKNSLKNKLQQQTNPKLILSLVVPISYNQWCNYVFNRSNNNTSLRFEIFLPIMFV